MADITVTAANVGLVDPMKAELWPCIAASTITKGQACYIDSNGKAAPADATTGGGLFQFRGVALKAAAAGQAVTLCKRGALYGYTLTGVAYSGPVFLSETTGAFADATPAGTGTAVVCGVAVALTDKDLTKVFYVDARWGVDWS